MGRWIIFNVFFLVRWYGKFEDLRGFLVLYLNIVELGKPQYAKVDCGFDLG